MNAPPKRFHGERIVLALAVTETVSWGVLYYAISVLDKPMERELGWSRAIVMGGFSVALLVQALAAIPVGRWLDRHGARGLMTAGSLAATLLVLAWSRVTDVLTYYLVWAGLGVAMAAVLYEPAFAVVTRWFVRGRARALMTVTLVAGLASTIFLPLAEALVTRVGWRTAVATLALLMGLVTVPLHALVLRRDPRDVGQEPDGLAAPPADGPAPAFPRASVPASVAVRSRSFLLLAAGFVLASISTAAVGAHLVTFLIEHGHGSAGAASLAGAVGLMQLPGRMLHPLLQRRLPPGRVTPLLLAAQALALLALPAAVGGGAILAVGAVLGMASGLLTLARASEIAERFGAAHYGRISGVLSSGMTLARAAGPVGAAWLLAGFGGYGAAFGVLAGLSALGAGLAWSAGTASAPGPYAA